MKAGTAEVELKLNTEGVREEIAELEGQFVALEDTSIRVSVYAEAFRDSAIGMAAIALAIRLFV